jgi:Protein of unknown function (DUF732)
MRKFRVITEAVALAIALAAAPTAHADSTDDYLAVLHKHGLSMSGGQSEEIQFGHKLCDWRMQGMSNSAIATMGEMNNNSLDRDDWTLVVEAAEVAFCPGYLQ